MDTTGLLALAGALGWASGLRLYLVVFITGLAGYMGWFSLPTGLHALQHPLMLGAGGFMLFIEFFADKIPGVDSLWDLVHSVVRVPAGAALAAGVFGADSTMMGMAAALLGGSLAATAQATKTATRAAINTSPEPFSNITASVVEEGLVVGGMWLATTYPLAFAACLFVVLVISVFLIVHCIRFLRAIVHKVSAFLGGISDATGNTTVAARAPVGTGI